MDSGGWDVKGVYIDLDVVDGWKWMCYFCVDKLIYVA